MIDAFITYLHEQIENHSIYVWGANGTAGKDITEQWIRSKETTKENADRAVRFWKKQVDAGFGGVLRAFDCSGLGVYFLLQNKLIEKDMSTNGLMRQCKQIKRGELCPGDFVFKVDSNKKAYHIGYVADESLNVIEAKGRDYGVVKTPQKGWDVYGRPPFFRDTAGNKKSRILKLASPYMRGDDAAALQTTLVQKGYVVGMQDAIYGPITEKAVRAFQAAAGLVVDGKAGVLTFTALGLPYYV